MKRYLFLHIALLSSLLAFSQGLATGLPFECGFEESEDLTAWVLNPNTSTATDQWMFGSAVHSSGYRSMYVSRDTLSEPSYGNHPNIVVSYMRYQFPQSTTQQNYELSFDWKGMGDSTHSKLYVMVCPEMALTQTGSYNLASITSTTAGRLSTAVEGVCQALGESGEKYVCGSQSWQNVTLTNEIKVSATNSQRVFAIVFIWANDNKSDTINNTSIAIDNLQINSASLKKPTNLQVVAQCEDSTLLVSWESGLPEFDVEYRKLGSATWRRASGLMDGMEGFNRVDGTKCSYIIPRILEGSYDVRVRGVSDELHTNYVYKNLVLVYCPDNHCVNYIDLYSPNVTCTSGHHPGAQAGATPYDVVGVIDFGPDAIESRHTLHIDPNEVDPRTDSLLHTVPKGALASVRLGNWKTYGEAESVTYDLIVDTTSQGILIVKYAVVLENPPGHPPKDENRFLLEVLDASGNLIDATCGQANFSYSDGVAAGWNMTKDGQVAWKDWTTIGVNLMPYHNQHIKVRFTTYDCGWSGHYGYAYFTVDCANAHIETENCGNDPYITCKAPDGFAYEWYNEAGQVVSNEQVLRVDASKQTYTCRVSFIEQPDCYFEISTLSAPRFPVPEYTFDRIYGECQSKLKFTNTSHVMNKFEGFEQHTSESCTDFHWEFKRLSNGEVKVTDARAPIYLCPSEGDSIEIKYTCYIGVNNSCDSTRVDTVVVPNIIPDSTEFRTWTCPESPVKFGENWYNTDTVVENTFENFAGCDSVSTLYLRVYKKPADVYIHDSICSDQAVIINGIRYNKPMVDSLIMLKTVNGCDSMLYLTLTVNQRIQAKVDTLSFLCADEQEMYFTFDITEGVYDSLGITFSTDELRDTMIYEPNLTEVTIPYPDTITPGIYQATLKFYQYCCGTYTQVRDVEIRYSSSIIAQKWNDVLTLLSPKYNGGFTFTAFQWYMNDVPIEGATHSYLYQPLDFESSYYVLITRSDGLVMTTCPVTPEYHEQQTPYPTIVTAGQQMPIYRDVPTTIWYYTISGQLYGSYTLPQGYATMSFPDQSGAYILKAIDANGETQAQVLLVQ